MDYALDRGLAHAAPGITVSAAAAPPPEQPARLRSMPSAPVVVREGDAKERLKAIREEIGDCRRCQLCKGRSKIVFGVGDPEARLMFVGEGPGADEDRVGEPFVGRAGHLLTDIITKGWG